MSNTEKQKEQPKEQPKNTSLCEDMNGHSFDQATFDKLSNEQANQMKNQK